MKNSNVINIFTLTEILTKQKGVKWNPKFIWFIKESFSKAEPTSKNFKESVEALKDEKYKEFESKREALIQSIMEKHTLTEQEKEAEFMEKFKELEVEFKEAIDEFKAAFDGLSEVTLNEESDIIFKKIDYSLIPNKLLGIRDWATIKPLITSKEGKKNKIDYPFTSVLNLTEYITKLQTPVDNDVAYIISDILEQTESDVKRFFELRDQITNDEKLNDYMLEKQQLLSDKTLSEDEAIEKLAELRSKYDCGKLEEEAEALLLSNPQVETFGVSIDALGDELSVEEFELFSPFVQD